MPQGIPREMLVVLAGIFGLLIGSFLNVVIYRMPVMLYRDWLGESLGNLKAEEEGTTTLWQLVFGNAARPPGQLEQLAGEGAGLLDKLPACNIAIPASRCGSCGHRIRWYENIPVVSYLFLRGRCSACKTAISLRYPTVELVVAALFALCAWRYGPTLTAVFWVTFCCLLVCQFLIDMDTQLLPDLLNYLLLWAGLLGAAIGVTGPTLHAAVWGAAAGYLSLWSVYHVYKLLTGKDGMGYGDFKLLAALGAWLGADYIIAVILMSSMVGALLGTVFLLVGKLANKDIPIAFGPFLAGAGLVCLVIGPDQVRHLVPFAFPFGRV